jgi:Uma2 family endonuclease
VSYKTRHAKPAMPNTVSNPFLDEYLAWTPGSKIELVQEKLIVGDRLSHSYLLLSQILRGWGIEAIVALAPEQLWWQALAATFDAPPVANLAALDITALQQWAAAHPYQPPPLQHQGSWSWSDSRLRQGLRMALFGLEMQHERLGQSLGGGCVMRLGEQAFMPDVMFFRGEPRNRLYEYYLHGAAELVMEFVQPGCEEYTTVTKRSHYQAAGIPEYWVFQPADQQIQFWRLIDGHYQRQSPIDGRYAIASVPGLTFFPDRCWLPEKEWKHPLSDIWFEVAADAPRLPRLSTLGDGIDRSKALQPFAIALEPVPIPFADYIYWCPEAKFEFVNGRPDIGGHEGIKGLSGMLLMTFGLAEVVKLAHPSAWVNVLAQLRTQALDPNHKADWWQVARQTATFLRDHYRCDRIAAAGDLVAPRPLTFWSELVLVVWGLSEPEQPTPAGQPRYTSAESVLYQLSESPRIRLVNANKTLTESETQLLDAGLVEL